MPERWQRQLARLGAIAPSDDLRTRVQDRSTLVPPARYGEGGPAWRRFAVVSLWLLTFLPAGYFGWVVGRASATPENQTAAASTQDLLDVVADSMAVTNGDPNPRQEEYVETTHHAANRALGSSVSGSDFAVYLLKVTGDFSGGAAKGPRGFGLVRGQYLYIVVDAQSIVVTDWAISDHSTDLASLGDPKPLP